MKTGSKQHCEYLRSQAKEKFNLVRGSWCDQLRWAAPHRASWITSTTPGERKNQHIVDGTHILALRSYVAGFLEGNTSASRPWYRIGTKDRERNENYENKAWLQHLTERTLSHLGSSNFYHASGNFYYDLGAVDTGAHYVETFDDGRIHFHTLMPGAYFVLDNALGEAHIMVREFSLNILALVKKYVKKDKNGKLDWSNVSEYAKKAYEDGNYSTKVDIVHIVLENPDYDPMNPDIPTQRQWLELTYELGGNARSDGSSQYATGSSYEPSNEKFLKRFTGRRKPFIVGKSTDGFEYGERGPTRDALGLIKSLNKKAISKDIALEQMVNPTLQGPAGLRKSYVSNAPGTFVPIDARSAANKQKLESVFQINPAIGALIQDVGDARNMVDKFYYADFLLFLSKNPKTRTATETDAIIEEQQRIIGPNLQSLNFSYNVPVIEWIIDYVLYEDPFLQAPPKDLEGQNLKPEFISVFAQAQRAFDLPQIDRYVAMVSNVAQINPSILDKINLDKLADLYEDRLYLPAGLNNPQSKVDAKREQAAKMQQRQMALQETLPAVAGAAKDLRSAQPQMG